jgi:hypothetical protein
MQIDRTDLSILRAIEWGGIISHNTALRKLKLEDAEIQRRLKRCWATSGSGVAP